MAHPSDLPGEVIKSLAEAPPQENYSNLDDARRKRSQARRTEALSLRLAGLSYDQIGDRLGITTSGARDLINRTLARAENRLVEQERALENERLDRAQAAIWADVLRGDPKAVDTFLRISARRAKMNGLDAPTSIAISMDVRTEMVSALEDLERIVLGEVIDYGEGGTGADVPGIEGAGGAG